MGKQYMINNNIIKINCVHIYNNITYLQQDIWLYIWTTNIYNNEWLNTNIIIKYDTTSLHIYDIITYLWQDTWSHIWTTCINNTWLSINIIRDMIWNVYTMWNKYVHVYIQYNHIPTIRSMIIYKTIYIYNTYHNKTL